MSVTFTDNSAEFLQALEIQTLAGLEACGNQAVSHSKQIVMQNRQSHTGKLLDINHKVVGETCYVGTNTRYAIYHEMGTGIYIAGGRKTPWHYQDGEGTWHTTRGLRPIHFIKNAVANYTNEYVAIIKKYLRGG